MIEEKGLLLSSMISMINMNEFDTDTDREWMVDVLIMMFIIFDSNAFFILLEYTSRA